MAPQSPDGAANAANLGSLIGNPIGILQIDTTAPILLAATTSPVIGDLGIGQVVTFTAISNEAVTVTGGPPTLSLNDGGTASYNAAASTPTSLVFTYTVAPGPDTADMAISATALNGAIIADAAGNAADLGSLIGNPVGVLQIDTTAPTLAPATTAPAIGDLGIGQVVSFTTVTNEPVSVAGGTPMLTLNDGGTATYDAAASTPTSLVFSYAVSAGQNTADLSITAAALNGATITDAAGNAASLGSLIGNPAGILQVDTTAPTLAAATTTPATGDLGIGQVVTFTTIASEAVSVTGGTPTLTLNDGGIATYNVAASTPTSLVFSYTVAPGQNAADLAITATALNGATIADGAGNSANLSSLIGNPAGILQVDTTAPTLAAATTAPATGDLGVGQLVAFTVATSEPGIVAGGTPMLTLNDGGTATYNAAASTPTSLVFTYTVAAGQNTADLAIAAAGLNGATITDAAGNAATLGSLIGNPAGILQVDTTAPVLLAATTSPVIGDLGIGQVVTFTVATSEAVSVTGGTPTLTLNDGGTASYNAAASTATSLVFSYTVAAGQNTADLAITAAALNGATVADGAGNAANLGSLIGNPIGILQVDTTAPILLAATASPVIGDLGIGQVVTFTATTSEAVSVTGGTPTLILNDGGTATYDAAASTATSLVFSYTVAAGQNTGDLAITATALNGAIVADAAGNITNLGSLVDNPVGILQVDTTAPILLAAATSPMIGDLGIGQIVTFTVATSEAVSVTGGTPTLALNDGGTATYNAAASTPTSLVFSYVVAPGQNTADLSIAAAALNGATVVDAAGNAANLGSLIGNPVGILQVDTTAPSLAAATTAPATGDLGIGQVVTFTTVANEPVSVTGGTPTLTLNDGGTATYNAAGSTPTSLVFTYTVAAGQDTADLAITAAALNGATIADAAGNTADPSSLIGNPAGVLQVDTTAPTLAAATTAPAVGDLGIGQVVSFTVATSQPVIVVGGTPTLTLSDGGIAVYNAAASTATSLVFSYTVAPGQNTADLAITATALNGATVADGAGNAASLSGLIGNPVGILQIDTTAPTVTGVTTSPSSGSAGIGQVITFTVATSEAVSVTGGTPTLSLNNGGTATYNAAASTATSLAFSYTVALGQDTPGSRGGRGPRSTAPPLPTWPATRPT